MHFDCDAVLGVQTPCSSLVLSSLELSDTTVYEPTLRELLGAISDFCVVVVPKPRTVPNCTGLYSTLIREKVFFFRLRQGDFEVFPLNIFRIYLLKRLGTSSERA